MLKGGASGEIRKLEELFVGGRYLSTDGHNARVIENIHGDDVHWRDRVGSGRCSRQSFQRWADVLAPDSLAPPPARKRSKPVSRQIIETARKELPTVEQLVALGDIETEMPTDQQDAIRAILWLVRSTARRLELAIRELPGNKNRLRIITRIDVNATLLKEIIVDSSASLDAFSVAPSGDGVRQLAGFLSESSASLNRLRSTIAPCLAR